MRLAAAALTGAIASLSAFVAFALAISLLHVGSLPLGAVGQSMFFVFFFAGLPILAVATCGGIPLYLLLQHRVTGHARTVFLLSGAGSGALVAFFGWHHIWATFSPLLLLAGTGVGVIGAYVFWKLADG